MTKMTLDDYAFLATWRPASGHPGGWRVCREFWDGGGLHQACGPKGSLRLFRTREAAQKAAAALNATATDRNGRPRDPASPKDPELNARLAKRDIWS